MAHFEPEQVRRILNRYGFSFRPGDSESSNTSAWEAEYDFWRMAAQVLGTTPAQNADIARKLVDAVVGRLNLTPLDDRPAALKRFNEECGVDFIALAGVSECGRPLFYDRVNL